MSSIRSANDGHPYPSIASPRPRSSGYALRGLLSLRGKTSDPSGPADPVPPLLGLMQDGGAAGHIKPPRVRPMHRRKGLSREILVGEAGANLVLSKLQSWGIPAQPAMPGLAYDILADCGRFGVLRLQVKTRARPTGRRYVFEMKRGYYYSRQSVFDYAPGDYDIAAFVCLPVYRVFFRAAPVKLFTVRAEWFATRIDDIERWMLRTALLALPGRPPSDPGMRLPVAAGSHRQGVATPVLGKEELSLRDANQGEVRQ